jgi:uncharacterized heparinase superfamily protein
MDNLIISKNFEILLYYFRRFYLFAAKGPFYHYTYAKWRMNRWLQKKLCQRKMQRNSSILKKIDYEQTGLDKIANARARKNRNLGEAIEQLVTYFRTRKKPSFFWKSEDKEKILSLIPVDQKQATIHQADRICQNIFSFRGLAPVQFKESINWFYCPNKNIDWTWDLNRHTYFETLGRAYSYTGNARYADKFHELVIDWIKKNPASVDQPNWQSVFEVSFRINIWIWAFHYFRQSSVFDNETFLLFLNILEVHGNFLYNNIEIHAKNNHLLLEAKALAMLGILFPEFKKSKKYLNRGLKFFYNQIQKQVYPDGVHCELSSHYHRVISGELLEFLVLLENNDISIPDAILEIFSRMLEFELWMIKPDGLFPLLGDAALNDTYFRFPATAGGPIFLEQHNYKSIIAPLNEACVWLLGYERVKHYMDKPATSFSMNSRAFPDGGYFVMRSGKDNKTSYLIFDCGPFGLKSTPNHGHADALNFELYALGRTMIVDPGIYSSHMGEEWRNFFRGSHAHNTVVVDDQNQSILVDTQRVCRSACTTLNQWLSNEHFDFVDGSHNGYEHLPKPVTHRRQIIFIKPEYWVVTDILQGKGSHSFDQYFHLIPGEKTKLISESGILKTGNELEPGLMIIPLQDHNLSATIIEGSVDPIQGWISLYSGEKKPVPTIRYRKVGIVPVVFTTVLYPYSSGNDKDVKVYTLELNIDDGKPNDVSRMTGLRIEMGDYTDYLLLDRGTQGVSKNFNGYQTDAQIAYLRIEKGKNRPLKAVMQGGQYLSFHGKTLLRSIEKQKNIVVNQNDKTSMDDEYLV